MPEHMVQLENVSKKIGRKTIIDGLSFQVNPGEIFGLLGPNGAGKTTTIRMMVGLISLSAGKIFINGLNIADNFNQAISHVGAIVENPEFYKFLTGYQNLLHYANLSPHVTRGRIEEVITFVGMEKRIHDKVKTYSLGMRQRLGVAQALLHRPSVLILDEPVNGLDPAGIKELREYLRSLAKHEGVSVIISSHLLAEMEMLCDRVAIIQKGRLLDVKDVGHLVQEIEGNFIVTFEVDRPVQAHAEINKHFSGVTAVCRGNTVEVNTNRETVPEITACLVRAGVKVYGILPKAKSLEDIFMEVTVNGPVD
jgi:ABC-2 type transport system ATP-binding protein